MKILFINELIGFILPIMIIIGSSYLMWRGCKIFAAGSSIVGYRLPSGVRGATINAIGSSLPEFFTALLFFFILSDSASGISAALGTVVGSAIFNILIIPAIVISILIKKNQNLTIKKSLILRDGSILIIAQFLLLFFISDGKISSKEGGILLLFYLLYVFYLFKSGKWKEKNPKINSKKLKNGWINLLIGCFIAGFGSWICVEVCELLSHKEWNTWWSEIFTKKPIKGLGEFKWASIGMLALLLAAAASSIPDLFISMIDARKGKTEDALSNTIGSNIFDICIAFSLPLSIYTLLNNGIDLKIENSTILTEVNNFIILMILITIMVLTSVLFVKKFHQIHIVLFSTLFIMFIYLIFNQDILANFINYLS